MARDRAKDALMFNCGEEHEINYVAGLYEDRAKVKAFLIEKCQSKEIYHFTHEKVYHLIEEKLGLPTPGGK